MTNWSEEQFRQLHLFKGKRQKGEAPPPALEFELQCLVADVLRRWCNPSWRYTHIPLGEYRTKATAGRLKRMGVTAGWPDFIFLHCHGRVCLLELKREGEKPTEVQIELGLFLRNAGHGYCLADNFNAAIAALKQWGVLPARISHYTANTNIRDTPWPPSEERAIE